MTASEQFQKLARQAAEVSADVAAMAAEFANFQKARETIIRAQVADLNAKIRRQRSTGIELENILSGVPAPKIAP